MLRCLVTLQRRNNNGILDRRVQVSRSWTRHLLDVNYQNFSNLQLTLIKDITNTDRTIDLPAADSNHPNGAAICGPAGGCFAPVSITSSGGAGYNANSTVLGDDNGIIVGSNAAAAIPLDFALNTKIAHGTAPGQLLYGGTEGYGLLFVDPNGQFTLRRYFTNHSGGDVTVREVGIYGPGHNATYVNYQFCMARDVVAPDVVVADTEILEVTYVVQITV